ncbi:nucleoside deaminase [Bacillus suaedaesalsae]|uniref:Nucleoside deaminase n=1 Tax=Bacillus suaedaesalsae TaxID=2810349 RepID=A0ABS2DHJ9_9BACI|nr:nucleoside deaminase [Bacillus suaedaesalsae]MBM6617961.1 nucleoside deaminase [Bacillus suaedaesalsae]
MKWSDIPVIWQACFHEAWASFQEGSRPVGAIVVNEDGKIVASGKSSTFKETADSVVYNNELAHAEVNALLKLDNRVHQKVNRYILYSTLEPCPLCFSAFYMSGIRNLEYAAKDRYGGSTNLKDTTPYLTRKNITITGPFPYLEELSVMLNIYFDMMIDYTKAHPVHDDFAKDYPRAVSIAYKWVEENRLADFREINIEQVYERLIEEIMTTAR